MIKPRAATIIIKDNCHLAVIDKFNFSKFLSFLNYFLKKFFYHLND